MCTRGAMSFQAFDCFEVVADNVDVDVCVVIDCCDVDGVEEVDNAEEVDSVDNVDDDDDWVGGLFGPYG